MKKETREAKNLVIQERKAKFTNAQIQRYKELAVTRKDRMKYTQEYLSVLFNLANEYVLEQADKKKPLTIAGFQRRFGMTKDRWYSLKNGEMDHVLYEFLAEHDLPEDYADGTEKKIYEGVPLITYSEFIDGIYLRQQELLEEACITKQNPVGCIFLMKAMHGHSDTTPVTTNTMNISIERFGSLDEIERARKLLG